MFLLLILIFFVITIVLAIIYQQQKQFTNKTLLLITLGLTFCTIFATFLILNRNFALPLKSFLSSRLDWDDHYLSCDKLPEISKVEEVYKQHVDFVEDNSSQSEGVSISIWDYSNESNYSLPICPKKADIEIIVETKSQRDKLKRLLKKDFFGIPYRIVVI